MPDWVSKYGLFSLIGFVVAFLYAKYVTRPRDRRPDGHLFKEWCLAHHGREITPNDWPNYMSMKLEWLVGAYTSWDKKPESLLGSHGALYFPKGIPEDQLRAWERIRDLYQKAKGKPLPIEALARNIEILELWLEEQEELKARLQLA